MEIDNKQGPTRTPSDANKQETPDSTPLNETFTSLSAHTRDNALETPLVPKDPFAALSPIKPWHDPPTAWATVGTQKLAQALNNPDESVSYRAAWGLRHIATSEAVLILKQHALKALSNKDTDTLNEIASHFASLGTPAAREALRDLSAAAINSGDPHSLCLYHLDECTYRRQQDMSLEELKQTAAIVETANQQGNRLMYTRMSLEDRQATHLDPDNIVPFIKRNFHLTSKQLDQLETLAKEGRVELTRFTSNAGKHMIDPHTGHTIPAKPSLSIALLPPGETYQIPPDTKRRAQAYRTFTAPTPYWQATDFWPAAVAPERYPPKEVAAR